MATGKFGVGVIGCGTVGGGVVKLLVSEAENLRRKTGVEVVLCKAADIDPAKRQSTGLPASQLTENAQDLLDDPEVRVVVEVIGGVKAAYTLVKKALEAGKHVVTANKELLAKKGPELLALARQKNVTLHFEASACGGIPVIHALGQSLAVNRFERLYGIVNGTTNFILTKMHREGAEFDQVLREAQALGYAEADPTADVDGHDATYKLAILASLAFNTAVDYQEIHTEGIRGISARDIELAKEYGYVIKLLAIGIAHSEDSVELRVHPMMIRHDHPLAAVNDSFNGVFARGNHVGDVMFYGRGAGQMPTASAILGDIIDIAMHHAQGGVSGRMNFGSRKKKVIPMGEVQSKFYLRLEVRDRPGVLASIARVFGECEVSIAGVKQKEATGKEAELVILTHEVRESAMQKAVAEVGKLDVVLGVRSMLRADS